MMTRDLRERVSGSSVRTTCYADEYNVLISKNNIITEKNTRTRKSSEINCNISTLLFRLIALLSESSPLTSLARGGVGDFML